MANDGLAGRRLGSFEIVEPLGQGGFATVYRARQIRLGRDVALKVLDPVLARNADAARRFEREGLAAAGLDHACIVPVYEAGEEDGMWYLAMRLVEGSSFAEELDTSKPSPGRIVAVVRAVGDALDHAHSRGVLHRDVKPANILVDGQGIWLADFGIAATAQQVGVYTLGVIGTLQYMAPEQARPGEADTRSDLYSLGCVAYECVTGRPPFVRSDLAGLLYAHAHDPVPPTEDAALDAFFARALAKEPDDRFQSGAELARALGDALGIVDPYATLAPPAPSRPARPRAAGGRTTLMRAAVALLIGVAAVAAFLLARAARDDSSPPTAAPTTLAPTTINAGADQDRIRSFLEGFGPAARQGDAVTLAAALDPAVIARYGRQQCEAALAAPDPTANVVVVGFTAGPVSHEFRIDGEPVVRERTYAVAVSRTALGQTNNLTFNLVIDDTGAVRWFSDCGNPVTTTTTA